MRFLVLNTDYPEFLNWLYVQHPGLEKQPYQEQIKVRAESLFGQADFYSSNLRKLGHEAWDICANNEFMQKAWARENGLMVKEGSKFIQRRQNVLRQVAGIAGQTPLRYLRPLLHPVVQSLYSRESWFYDILTAQIKHYKPDVLLIQVMRSINHYFLKEMKMYVRLLVGQHAATKLPDSEDWGCYDLVISSFPPTVDWFRQKAIPAELNRLGFEPNVFSYLRDNQESIAVSFVGSFIPDIHSSRVTFLETVCAHVDIETWGPSVSHIRPDSPILRYYNGQAWGRDMYQILRNSKITLNHHGDIEPYANNHRLYEATGVGTLLITDWKENLHEMFEPYREVVAYRSPEECIELIKYYLEHDNERREIARAGQQRTLKEHTYYRRMQELVDTIQKYL